MAKDVSIMISAKDNYTQAITTMRNSNQAFNKDLEGLTGRLNELNKTKISIKMETDSLKRQLQEAQKQFKKTGEAADELAVKAAMEKLENGQRNLRLVSKNAQQAEKDIINLTDAVSRAENRASSSGFGKGGIKDLSDMASSLSKAGIGNLLGASLSSALGAGIGSSFGDDIGGAITSTLSGAVSGAALGSIVPGLGTAIGAAVGTVAGGIGAATQVFEKKDEAFKSAVQGMVEGGYQQQEADLQTGSQIAADREITRISFNTLLGEEEAGIHLEDIQTLASSTPFGYDQLAQMSKILKTYGYTTEEGDLNIIDQLVRVGDAGAALGMSPEDINMIATSIGRINASGKTALEYLNPLIERGIPVIKYLAEASGKTEKQIYDMVSKGLIPGAEAAKAISLYMESDFGGSMEEQAEAFSGIVSSLQDAQELMQAAMGEGYNEERKKGIQEQNEYLDGESGQKMQDANRLIGQWKASLENEREALIRQYEQEALEQIERDGLEGAKAGEVLAKARIEAQAEFNASEGAQLELESQKSLIESVRDKLVQDKTYWSAGYELGKEYSKGISSAIWESNPWDVEYDTSGVDYSKKTMADHVRSSRPGFAHGLPYVPRDNFIARLHEGERVLTASEARSYDGGKSSKQPLITGNKFVVREEADIDKIARALASELEFARQIT